MQEHSRFYTPVYTRGDWIWREPMAFAEDFCVDDRNLKCMLEPMYGLLKYGINARRMKMDEYNGLDHIFMNFIIIFK